MHENLYNSLMTVTALTPHIGYENAAKAVHLAHTKSITLKEACTTLGFLSPEEFDECYHPERMI